MLSALVAGAGPAGSTAALLLARARAGVRIYERSAFPRTKVCGEYLSPRTVRLLYELGVAPQLESRARAVHGVRLHGHGIHTRIDFPAPGWSLPRSVLDGVLLDSAVAAGAQLERGRVEDCTDGRDSAHVAVRLPDGSLQRAESGAVIAADGMHSIVARACGMAPALQQSSGRFALGGHYCGFAQLDTYIDMFVAGRSYLAVNPLSDDSANVMLVVDASELQTHRGAVDAFAEERARRLACGLLTGAQLQYKRVATGPLSYRARRLAGRHVLLAGDAALLLDPFTGQGVYLALHSARIAAECVLTGSLHEYAARVQQEMQARRRSAWSVARLIGSPLLARAGAAALRRAPWLLQPLVSAVTGAA